MNNNPEAINNCHKVRFTITFAGGYERRDILESSNLVSASVPVIVKDNGDFHNSSDSGSHEDMSKYAVHVGGEFGGLMVF
jgi:hypothetical protein